MKCRLGRGAKSVKSKPKSVKSIAALYEIICELRDATIFGGLMPMYICGATLQLVVQKRKGDLVSATLHAFCFA